MKREGKEKERRRDEPQGTAGVVVVSGVTPSDKGWVALAGAVEVPSAAVIFRRRVKRSQKGDGGGRTFERERERLTRNRVV